MRAAFTVLGAVICIYVLSMAVAQAGLAIVSRVGDWLNRDWRS